MMDKRFSLPGRSIRGLLLLTLGLCVSPLWAQEPANDDALRITLLECVERGIAVSPQLDEAEAGVLQNRARLETAKRRRWPSLELSGGYTRLSEVESGEITIPSADTLTLPSADTDSVSVHAAAVQPIFTGFEIETGIRTIEELLKKARLAREHSLREVRYGIEQAYWNFVNASASVEVVSKGVERAESLLKDVRRLFAQGMATREDVLRMEMNREQALLQKLEAGHIHQLAMMELNLLIGEEPGRQLDPVYRFDPDSDIRAEAWYEDADYQQILTRATVERSELRLIEIQKEVQALEKKKISAGWWPKISLQGQVQYANPHPRQFPPEDQFILSWQFGVMGTISFTSLKATGPELERIEGMFQELDSRRETLIKTISLQIKRDLLEIEKSRQLLEASATILAQARENYDIVYNKFRSGSAVNTDLLSAQQELLQAQLERTRAYTALRRAESQLAYDAGYGDAE